LAATLGRVDEEGSVMTGNMTRSVWLAQTLDARDGPAAERGSAQADLDEGDSGAALNKGDSDAALDEGAMNLGSLLISGSEDTVDDTASDVSQLSSGADSAPRRFTPWVAAAMGAATVLATVITLVITLVNSPSADPEVSTASASAPVRVVEVAPPSPPPNLDGPLPFTASSDCAPGSTAAQSVADPHSTTPWVCVRSVDGQVLEIDLGRTFVITAVSIVPGAVHKIDANPDQPDPWLQHRVVTRVQWQFNDTDRSVRNQNTGNVRGEAVEAIRPSLLASKITVIILETSRPPVITPPGTDSPPPPGAGPSILGEILGGNPVTAPQVPILPGAPSTRDPADGTFAVSSIKIIGHKAV